MAKPHANPNNDDPIAKFENDKRSLHAAILTGVIAVAAVAITAAAVALWANVDDGHCTDSAALCSDSHRMQFVVIPTVVVVGFALYASAQTYLRWKRYARWWPWLFLSQLMWIAATSWLIGSTSSVFLP